MEKGLFSIILLHFNQPDYYQLALDSIFEQTYSKIQLIFADDCSTRIDKDEIRAYVEENKKENIVDVVYRFGEINQGTVKNLNGALNDVKGEYLLFFAADDALYDKDTIANFVKSFEEEEERQIVTAQCLMFDENLEEELSKFVDPEYGEESNQMTSEEQFREMALQCRFAIGATAFRMSTFEKHGRFDEEYVFVEDYSYWLRYLRNGGRIHYSNFGGLKHRDGGISHNNKKEIPPHVKKYMLDMLNIREMEVLPYMKRFPLSVQQRIMEIYDWERINYANTVGTSERPSRFTIYSKSPLLFGYVRIKRVVKHILAKENKVYFGVLKNVFLTWVLFIVLNTLFAYMPHSNSIADVLMGIVTYACSQYICPIITGLTVGVMVVINLLKFGGWMKNKAITYFGKKM